MEKQVLIILTFSRAIEAPLRNTGALGKCERQCNISRLIKKKKIKGTVGDDIPLPCSCMYVCLCLYMCL